MATVQMSHRLYWVILRRDGLYWGKSDSWCKSLLEARTYRGSIIDAKKWARQIKEAHTLVEVEMVRKVVVLVPHGMRFTGPF